MKRSTVFILFIFCLSLPGIAQFESETDQTTASPPAQRTNKSSSSADSRVVVGGGLDLRFGDVTVIGVTPLLGYMVTDRFMTGGIFTYRYFQDNRRIPSYSTSTYGVAPFVRYNVFRGLFVHAEYEALYGQWYYNSSDYNWVKSFFVGGGYGVPIGNHGFMGISFLWNLTEDPNYPIYNNPVVRMNFGIGL